MTPSSPQQEQAAYEYLRWCRADIAQETIVLDSTRISKLTLAKAVPLREKVNNFFSNLWDRMGEPGNLFCNR